MEMSLILFIRHGSVLHELIDSRDRVWASKELQDKVFSEAERRAEINKAQLRKYGFEI